VGCPQEGPRLDGGERLDRWPVDAGRAGEGGDVARDQVPAHGLVQRGPQQRPPMAARLSAEVSGLLRVQEVLDVDRGQLCQVVAAEAGLEMDADDLLVEPV